MKVILEGHRELFYAVSLVPFVQGIAKITIAGMELELIVQKEKNIFISREKTN